METKTSVLKNVKPTGKQDMHGNWGFGITFENGDSGLLNSKSDQIGSIGFVVGKEVTYNIERKLSKAGNEWFKITRPEKGLQPNTSFTQPANNGSNNNVQDQIIRQSSVKAAIDFMIGSGVNLKLNSLLETADIIFNYCKNGLNNKPSEIAKEPEPFGTPIENDLPW